MSLKQGDKVVMHTCMEAEIYNGNVWTCRTNETELSPGQNVVWLENFSGCFHTKYLQRVNLN
jgi:hypothetical protein